MGVSCKPYHYLYFYFYHYTFELTSSLKNPSLSLSFDVSHKNHGCGKLALPLCVYLGLSQRAVHDRTGSTWRVAVRWRRSCRAWKRQRGCWRASPPTTTPSVTPSCALSVCPSQPACTLVTPSSACWCAPPSPLLAALLHLSWLFPLVKGINSV